MKLGSFNIKHDLEIFLRVRISSLSEKLFSDCLVHPFKIHFVTSVSDFVYYYCQWFWRFSSVLELQRVRFPLISNIFQRFNFPINFRKIRNVFQSSLRHACSSTASFSALSVSLICLYCIRSIHFPNSLKTVSPKMLLNFESGYQSTKYNIITIRSQAGSHTINTVLCQNKSIVWKHHRIQSMRFTR